VSPQRSESESEPAALGRISRPAEAAMNEPVDLDDRFHESCHKRGFIWIFGLLYRSRVPKMSGVEVSWQRGGGRLNCRLEMRIRRS
jgi:hypothetical protein